MNWLTRPIELPSRVQRLLPRSSVRAFAAAVIIALWLRPSLDVSGSLKHPGDHVAGWQLWGLFPANLTVPLTALVLLVCAWRGYRRIELLSVLVLWLHAIVIATLVPLKLVWGWGDILLTLYVAMVSALCSALVAPPSVGSAQSIDSVQSGYSARLQSEVRRVIIMGCGVGILAVILLFPVFVSEAATSRESNLLYAGLVRVFGPWSRSGPTRAFSALPSPPVADEPPKLDAPRVPVSAPPMVAYEEDQTRHLSAAQRCQLGAQMPADLFSSTRAGLRAAVTAPSASKMQVASVRQRLFQDLVDGHLNPYSSSWLSVTLPSLQTAAMTSGLLTTMLPWDADLSAPPDIEWTRPIIANSLARYSAKRAESEAPAAESVNQDESEAPLAESVNDDESEAPTAAPDQSPLSVFPLDFECAMAGSAAANPRVWLYPMAGTTPAVPQLEMRQDDGRLLLRLPVASVERAASIVDFARFIGAEVLVTLARREATEISPGEPDESWPGLSWGIEVTTDLPALVIAGDKLIPGRLVHVHGDEPCVADSSIDIVMEHAPGTPVTGFVLLADNSLAERVTVLSVQSKQNTHEQLRSSRSVTLVDVTGDGQADLTFQSVRYEVRANTQDGDARWTTGPWSWVGVASSERDDAPYDRVTYPGCEKR